METNVTSGIATQDAETRMLNAKAREQAKQDMKNINTGKPVTSTKPAKPETPKKADKKPELKATDKLDNILQAGGLWADIVAKANTIGGNVKYSASVIKAHIRYRQVTQKKADYLKGYNVTDKGIELPKKGKK